MPPKSPQVKPNAPVTLPNKAAIQAASATMVAGLRSEGHANPKCDLDATDENVNAETTSDGFTARVTISTSDPNLQAYIQSGKLAAQLKGQIRRFGNSSKLKH